jgi:hypothetical protein
MNIPKNCALKGQYLTRYSIFCPCRAQIGVVVVVTQRDALGWVIKGFQP